MKKISYSNAFEKLESLVHQLEEGAFPLEDLPEKVKLANELVAYCEEKLHGIKGLVQDQMTDDEEE